MKNLIHLLFVIFSLPVFAHTYPMALRYVPEMEFITEADTWDKNIPKLDSSHISIVNKQWEQKYTFAEDNISRSQIRKLSQWAKKEMRKFRRVPSLANLTFTPYAYLSSPKKILFRSTVASLPSHSDVVKRYLYIFIIYDEHSKKITETIFTIRGDLLE